MTSKSKSKGNAFENEIAKFLNIIYDTEAFARTPLSGAFLGRSNSHKRSGIAPAAQDTLRGDLITPSTFPYIVECKSYKDSPIFHKLLEGSDAHVDKWLAEVEHDCENDGSKLPMLWFKTSRKGIFVALPKSIVPNTLLQNVMLYRNDYIIMSKARFSEIATTIAH